MQEITAQRVRGFLGGVIVGLLPKPIVCSTDCGKSAIRVTSIPEGVSVKYTNPRKASECGHSLDRTTSYSPDFFKKTFNGIILESFSTRAFFITEF